MQRPPRLALSLLLLAPACDAAVDVQAETKTEAVASAEVAVAAGAAGDASVKVGGEVEIAADAFKLAEVTALVQAGTIETAEELEIAVNDPEAQLNRVDIDADGTIDHVEVIEVRGDAKVDFQFKVIPSSRATAVYAIDLATASVVADRVSSEVTFAANFSAGIHFSTGASVNADLLTFVAPASFEASAVFVAQPLLAWAFVVDRPVYTSVYVEAETGKWIPPGHLKHGHWKATGGLTPGFAVGGKGKGKGKVEAHGGGKASGKHDSKQPGNSNKPAPKSSSSKGNTSHGGGGGSSSKGSSSKGGSSKGGSSKGGSSKGGGGKGGSSKGGGGKGKK